MIERKSALFRRVDVLRVAPSLPILVAENSVKVWVYWQDTTSSFIIVKKKFTDPVCNEFPPLKTQTVDYNIYTSHVTSSECSTGTVLLDLFNDDYRYRVLVFILFLKV